MLLDGSLVLSLISFVSCDEGLAVEVEVAVEVVLENMGTGSSFVLDHHAHFNTLDIIETFPFCWISRIKGSEGHNLRPLITLGLTRAYSSLIPTFSSNLFPVLRKLIFVLSFFISLCFESQSVFVRAFERYDSGVPDPSP